MPGVVKQRSDIMFSGITEGKQSNYKHSNDHSSKIGMHEPESIVSDPHSLKSNQSRSISSTTGLLSEFNTKSLEETKQTLREFLYGTSNRDDLRAAAALKMAQEQQALRLQQARPDLRDTSMYRTDVRSNIRNHSFYRAVKPARETISGSFHQRRASESIYDSSFPFLSRTLEPSPDSIMYNHISTRPRSNSVGGKYMSTSNHESDDDAEIDIDIEDEDYDDAEYEEGSSIGGKRIRSASTSSLFQCIQCGKVYKHRNCLTKHRWEHHQLWEMSRKDCPTKHQQVQLLEAAQILVDINTGIKGVQTSSLGWNSGGYRERIPMNNRNCKQNYNHPTS